jgi:hypothetical protein
MSRHRQVAAIAYRSARGAAMAPGRSPRSRSMLAPSSTSALDLAILLCTALAVLAALTISPALLTHWKVQYVTAGGSFHEKLHPATYLVVTALCLALFRDGNPVQGLVRICASSAAVPLYLVCWLFLLVQTVLLERPFTAIVDTFLLPLLFVLAIWQTAPPGRRALAWVVHLAILLNVAIGYYEYFAGQRIIPLTLGNVLVIGEWRSAALLGHPLVASGLVGAYVLALTLRPQLVPQPLLRLPLIVICLGSLMAFGGRTALVTTLLIIAICLAFELFRVLRGGRISLAGLIVGIGVVFVGAAAVFAMLQLGLFDKMLLRFSSDKGSALARFAMLDLLGHLDWNEIVFGPTVSRANALQNELGLEYGIENFWIASVVQFGLVHTMLITAALAAFLTMLLRRSSRAALALLVLMTAIAASSVSFSSKNIQLTQFVLLIAVLLPRAAPPASPRPVRAHVLAARPVPAGSRP